MAFNSQPQVFRSDNLYIACFLMAQGSKFIRLELMKRQPQDKQLYYFVFDQTDELIKLNQDYINNADVPVGSFVNALNTLKGVIRSESKNRHQSYNK